MQTYPSLSPSMGQRDRTYPPRTALVSIYTLALTVTRLPHHHYDWDSSSTYYSLPI